MNHDTEGFTEVLFTQLSPGDYYVFEAGDVATSQLLGRSVARDGRTQWSVCAYGERSNGQPRMAAVLNPPRYVQQVTAECAGRRIRAAVRKVAGQ
jgi:hypothetical protein